jgi:hypothetical protein
LVRSDWTSTTDRHVDLSFRTGNDDDGRDDFTDGNGWIEADDRRNITEHFLSFPTVCGFILQTGCSFDSLSMPGH